MVKDEEEFIENLRASKEKVGMLVPVFEDGHGEIIDGLHRLKVDENWPRIRLEHVKTKIDRLILRLHLNVIRRDAPTREKTELLEEIGEILLKEGLKPGEISKRIAEETGMSYRWVMKYLPDKFKDESQKERASSAARRAATKMRKLLEFLKPPEEKLLTIGNYKNTERLHVIVEKPLHEEIREIAEKLDVTLDKFLQKTIKEKCSEMKALKPEEIEALRQALKSAEK